MCGAVRSRLYATTSPKRAISSSSAFRRSCTQTCCNDSLTGNALATHLERCLQELGGRLQGPELQSVLEPLLKGRRSYLPSAPLPGAEAETAFTPASLVAPHDPDDESTSRLTPFDEDPLTLVSQPGFLANFEDDDTLLSNPSLRQLDPSVLRTISGTADADTKLDEAAQKQQDRDPTVVRPETSGTAPTPYHR